MSERWLRDYIQLAFRIDKTLRSELQTLLQHAYENNYYYPLVDYYYGPAEWQASVEKEPVSSPGDLLRDVQRLEEDLSAQGFEETRATYLGKQLLALETISRRLCGETFSVESLMHRCFDIAPIWISDEEFKVALDDFNSQLPGSGTLADRLNRARAVYTITPEQEPRLPSLMQRCLEEVRERTRAFLALPDKEVIEVRLAKRKAFSANNHYLGGYRSLVELNMDTGVDLRRLLETACHEGYPGHHAEFVLKEHYLYHQRSYLEQTIGLLMTPQGAMSEGIATIASEFIFPQREQHQWIEAQLISTLCGKTTRMFPDPATTYPLRRKITSNAALMYMRGYSDQEIRQYLQRYLLLPNDQVEKVLIFVKRPFRELYPVTYIAGYYAIRQWLAHAPDPQAAFGRLLTEQVSLSQLTAVELPFSDSEKKRGKNIRAEETSLE